jgi:hypothetical protein
VHPLRQSGFRLIQDAQRPDRTRQRSYQLKLRAGMLGAGNPTLVRSSSTTFAQANRSAI